MRTSLLRLKQVLVGVLLVSCSAPELPPHDSAPPVGSKSQGLAAFTQQKKLLASDRASIDSLGRKVALSGDGNTALAGAIGDDDGALTDNGAVYVFVRSRAGTWIEQQKLLTSDRASTDRLGDSLALSDDGNTALIGVETKSDAGLTRCGAAYVFVRSAVGAWTEQRKLLASDRASDDAFGGAVALSDDGNTALIGARSTSDSGTLRNGGVYVFTRSNTAWTQKQKLLASDKASSDSFGYSVAIAGRGDTALIGAIGRAEGGVPSVGAAYVFTSTNDTWTQKQKLQPSDLVLGDGFGYAVALSDSGDTALIGVPGQETQPDEFDLDPGAAYVFTRTNNTWTQQQKFKETPLVVREFVGTSVSLSGDGNTALVGASGSNDAGKTGNGALLLYTRANGTWTQQPKLITSDAQSGDQIGQGTALSGDGFTALGGGQGVDDSDLMLSAIGAAYVFALPKPQGLSCGGAWQCESGFCVDGVCCQSACGGDSPSDCQACTKALSGLAADGLCGPIAAAAAFTCRPPSGVCDVAETCDGSASACPADAMMPPSQCSTAADLSITIAASKESTSARSDFTLLIKNAGLAAATNLMVTITLPDDTPAPSVSGNGWTCQSLAPSITCTRSSQDAGETSTILLALTPPAGTSALSIAGSVSGAEIDPDPSNNMATLQTSLLQLSFSGGGFALGCNGAPGALPTAGALPLLGLALLGLRRRRRF